MIWQRAAHATASARFLAREFGQYLPGVRTFTVSGVMPSSRAILLLDSPREISLDTLLPRTQRLSRWGRGEGLDGRHGPRAGGAGVGRGIKRRSSRGRQGSISTIPVFNKKDAFTDHGGWMASGNSMDETLSGCFRAVFPDFSSSCSKATFEKGALIRPPR